MSLSGIMQAHLYLLLVCGKLILLAILAKTMCDMNLDPLFQLQWWSICEYILVQLWSTRVVHICDNMWRCLLWCSQAGSAFVCLVVCNLLLLCCSTAVAVVVAADCDTDGIGLDNALSTPCLFVELCKHIVTSCSSVVTHIVGELG